MPLSDVTEKVAEMLKSPSKSLVFSSYCLYIVRALLECDIIDMSPKKISVLSDSGNDTSRSLCHAWLNRKLKWPTSFKKSANFGSLVGLCFFSGNNFNACKTSNANKNKNKKQKNPL